GLIRTHVRIDERDAGFLALGLARGLRAGGAGSAVALVTTSGSAVANLHPAVLEASYGHLPLLALTADRPARLRGTGANQTIDDQAHVLSDVRARFDLPAGESPGEVEAAVSESVAAALGRTGGTGAEAAGPVQLNVQFDTPLVPTAAELGAWKDEVSGSFERTPVESSRPEVSVTITDGTVIVAGDAGGHPAESLRALAAAHHLPVLAEPSNPLARGAGAPLVFAHARVLAERTDLTEAVRTVIVHGKPTLTRPVAALLADAAVDVHRVPDDVDALALSVTDEAIDSDDGAGSDVADCAASGAAWVRDWIDAGEACLAAARDERTSARKSTDTGEAASAQEFQSTARAVTEYLAAQDVTVFAASSNSVRYLSETTDIRAHIHASRGLAGIDGLVSTATGLSLGLDEPVVLLIGDIAMLHDIGGLLTPTAEMAGDVTIVVLNDDGGA